MSRVYDKVLETTIWLVRDVKTALRVRWKDGRCTVRVAQIKVFCIGR